ncbi:MAG: 1-(5-phosphoribosyl)-5-[(5-phosphoribosylamino)methylideneamino]imidazole-4-carboxamide isomerase, partial [Clostridia bacterium]|nr:1-(5-phosphoribosyl)-5-[(5-phosphoribosylamino)methylideneamino]imidazole-4-carboxamide isomerase [Clostridia bacterium]
MLIFPAIDLRAGRVVRLTQGDYDQMTVYSDDPERIAEQFMREGASCLHMVDLDGAKEGEPMNRAVIGRLAKLPLLTEVGGGMRDEASVEATLVLGVKRVILGTAAVTDFDFTRRMAQRFSDQIAVGVDAKNGFVATHGWQKISEENGIDFCRRLRDAGVQTVIYTDISRDGLLAGANIEVYGELAQIEGLCVVASGGVSTEADVRALAGLRLYGAIIGKALYTGKLSLALGAEAA